MYGALALRVLPYAGLAAIGLAVGWQVNGWRLNAKIESIQADHAKQYAAAQQTAREKEQALQAAADKLRREKDAQIRTLAARTDALIAQLRSRPERPTTGSLNPDSRLGLTAKGCDGTQLYRPDSEFLVREAARADQLREGYKQCTQQYETVRKYLNSK